MRLGGILAIVVLIGATRPPCACPQSLAVPQRQPPRRRALRGATPLAYCCLGWACLLQPADGRPVSLPRRACASAFGPRASLPSLSYRHSADSRRLGDWLGVRVFGGAMTDTAAPGKG